MSAVVHKWMDIMLYNHIPLGCLRRVLALGFTQAEVDQRVAEGKEENLTADMPEDRHFIRDDRSFQALMLHYGFLNKPLADFYQSRNMPIYSSRDKSKSKVRCVRWAGGTNIRPFSVALGDTTSTYNSMCMQGAIYLGPANVNSPDPRCVVIPERDMLSRRLCGVLHLDVSESSAIRP